MADTTDPNAPTTPPIDNSGLEEQNKLLEQRNKLNKTFGDFIATQGGKQAASINEANKALSSSVKFSKDFTSNFHTATNLAAQFSKNINSFSFNKKDAFDGLWGSATKAFNGVAQVALGVGNQIANNIRSNKSTVAAAGALMGNAWANSLKNTIYKTNIAGTDLNLDTIETALTDVDKIALQTGQNFGMSFEEASDAAKGFNRSLAESVVDTQNSMEEVKKVTGALGQYMSATQATTDQNGKLGLAVQGVASDISLTNAALLTANATGDDANAIAKLLGKSIKEMGQSSAEAIVSLGAIKSATESTGLSFSTARGSIEDNADALKLWGATVQSVSPLFKTFGNSLKGLGHEGLTPDLLKTFVSGMASMSTSAKALVGMRLPGQQGKGALQAAAQFEENMGTQEGIKENTKAMMDSLKRFGGGKITTLHEATQSAQGAAQFNIQRQLLASQFGISGAGQQAKLLEVFKKIEEKGFENTENANKELEDVLKGGEDTQKDTTTTLVKAMNDLTAAMQTAGGKVLGATKGAVMGTPVQRVLDNMSDMLEQGAKTGEIDKEAIKKLKNVAKPLKTIKEPPTELSKVSAKKEAGLNEIRKLFTNKKVGEEGFNESAAAGLKVINAAAKQAEAKIQAGFGYLKTGNKAQQAQYKKMLDQETKNVLSANLPTTGKNTEISGLFTKFSAMSKKERMAIEEGGIPENVKNNIKKIGGATWEQVKETNTGIGAIGTQATQQKQETAKEEKEKKQFELGINVRVINGSIRIDKEYIKEIAKETIQASNRNPERP